MSPSDFIAWLKRAGIDYPPELEAATIAVGQKAVDWKVEQDELKAYSDRALAAIQRKNDAAEQQLECLITTAAQRSKRGNVPTLKSYQKLVFGMAKDAFRFNPKDGRSKATQPIADALIRSRVPLDAQTIRSLLREAFEGCIPDDDPDQDSG